MPVPISKRARKPSAMLKPLLSSLILSMTLTGCALGGTTRLRFLTPTFRSDELTCKAAPRGQLPSTATNGDVANRIIDTDEAGEDCRQNLARVRMKVEVFNDVVAQLNAGKDPTKSPKKKDKK